MCWYFQRFPDPQGNGDGSEADANENEKLYYHRIGNAPTKDVLIAEFPENPKWTL